MFENDELTERLADYLGAAVERFRVLASGWETTIFAFDLDSCSPRCRTLSSGAPLVLRFYQGADGGDKGGREYETMCRLKGAGYVVPRPHLFEPTPDLLGAPFAILERLSGGPLFTTRSFPNALKTFSLGFLGFVRAQVRLHRMEPERLGPPFTAAAGAGAKSEPLLDRTLATIGERVERGPLPGLKLAWLELSRQAERFRAPPRLSPVHMDYHPLNVLVRGFRVTGVVDWINADVGDRHCDAAMTSVIMATSAMEEPRWMRDNVVGNTLRRTFTALYLPLYHAMAPLDLKRFRYYQAVAALLRLSMLGMMRARGPETVGFRPEAAAEVTPAVLRLLSRYATVKSGVPVRLEFPPAESKAA